MFSSHLNVKTITKHSGTSNQQIILVNTLWYRHFGHCIMRYSCGQETKKGVKSGVKQELVNQEYNITIYTITSCNKNVQHRQKKKDGLSALQERMNLLEKRYKNRSQWPIRGPELGNLSVMLIAKKASTVRKPKKAWTLASALHIIMPHYPVKFSFPKLSSKSTQHFPASNHPVVFASKQPINQTDCIPSPKKKKTDCIPLRPASLTVSGSDTMLKSSTSDQGHRVSPREIGNCEEEKQLEISNLTS